MKRGFIEQSKTAIELMRICKQFEQNDVLIDNISINISFEEFMTSVGSGDVIVIDSYTEIFGGFTDMLSRLIYLAEHGISIEPCCDPALHLDSNYVNVLKTILVIGSKVKTSRTLSGINRARQNGVKLGRPFGSTKVHEKVALVNKLCKVQGLSISKACREANCNPRTYYRYAERVVF